MSAVCDGSFDDDYSSAAWYIDGDGAIIRGVNIVPVGSDTLDATRCELAGIYTILRIIEYIIQYFSIENASIEIGSDCEGGLKRTLLNTDTTPLYYTNGSHLDMINAINHIRRTSVLKIKGRHIPAHQADSCVYEKLDWWAQRNDDMDWLAKSLMFEQRHLQRKTVIWRSVMARVLQLSSTNLKLVATLLILSMI